MSSDPVSTHTVLLTGATGTFGQALLDSKQPWTIRAFSRDEHKQSELVDKHPDVRWLLGDVRDLPRLRRAMEGCDTVIHAAALKHVTACEKNPGEALKTNAVGTMNVAEACLDTGVERAVFLSSDKAVHPVNVYGATKATAERVWLASNAYGGDRCKFSVVRYGNVLGSRGSILSKAQPVIRDSKATRFWMERAAAVDLVLLALREMQGGEVFVPKLQAQRVADLVYFRAGVGHKWGQGTLGPDYDGAQCEQCGIVMSNAQRATGRYGDGQFCPDAPRPEEPGLLPGEKLHETLIAEEEVPRTLDYGDHYRILPTLDVAVDLGDYEVRRVPADFSYSSERVSG